MQDPDDPCHVEAYKRHFFGIIDATYTPAERDRLALMVEALPEGPIPAR